MTPDRPGNGQVGIAHEAAAIPPARRGKERASRLSRGERLLYEWILRTFAAGDAPARETLAAAASGFDVDVEQALETLARADLVHPDSATGSILAAYPFSATPRGHRVLIDGQRWVDAMCAIDALGIAPMLNLPVEVVSRDPVNGREIWVRIDPGDGAWWEPEDAVVLAGSAGCVGPSFRSCCGVLNFFESGENTLRYLIAHPDITGHAISLPEAIKLGRIIFGDVLREV